MDKIKVGAVSYLNTKPLLYGIERSNLMQDIELVKDYPANIASLLLSDNIDVGLVPVAIIPQLPQAFITGEYCIGAEGDVASVCLFSQVPLEQVTTVVLDYQSRTSVRLVKVLLAHYWQKKVVYIAANGEFSHLIGGTTAGVVIGDRAFAMRKKAKYIYDLAGAWKAFTGLPFVFAAWVANKPLPADFIAAFNAANQLGVQSLNEVVASIPQTIDYPLSYYYTHNISYVLTPQKLQGLDLFLNYLKQAEL